MNLSDWNDTHTITAHQSDNNWRKSKLLELDFIFENNLIDGFVAEFGTWKNFTLNYIARKNLDRQVYGFDSLIGLPEEMDLGNVILPKYFNFDNAEPLEKNVIFYKGWFSDSIPDFKNKLTQNARFINIDGDHYLSAVDVLTNLNDRIVSGTVIRFDELVCWRTVNNDRTIYKYLEDKNLPYFTTWKQHEWRALTEWCKNYNRVVKPLCRSWFLGGSVVVLK